MYLKFYVFFLADIFEKFRNNSLKNYGLRQRHYLRAPGLNYDVVFQIAEIDLKLFPDADMYLFFKKGTRCGISYISYILAIVQKDLLFKLILNIQKNCKNYIMIIP